MEDLPSIVIWVIDILTIPASIIFLVSFIRVREKSVGIYMILILNIASWTLPIIDVLSFLIPNKDQCTADILLSALQAGYQFSLFWTAAVALFTYLILGREIMINASHFMIIALFICLIITTLYPISIVCELWGLKGGLDQAGNLTFVFRPTSAVHKFCFFLLFDLVGKMIPLIMTSYCYLKVYKVVRANKGTARSFKLKPSKVLVYWIVPLIIFVPPTLTSTITLLTDQKFPAFFKFVFTFGYHSLGLLNLYIYWYSTSRNVVKKNMGMSDESPLNQNLL